VIVAKQHQPEIADDGFEWVERFLGTWAHWMRHPGLRLGAPSRSPGFMSDITGGYRDSGEEAEIVGHDRAIQVIEATLDGFSPVERASVMHVHLYAVFRFRHPVDQIYRSARMKIGIRLRAHDFF